MANGVGVIDSDYRGELRVPMVNLSNEPYTIQPGERVAQLCIAPVWQAAFTSADELTDTRRGAGGFGSTGKIIIFHPHFATLRHPTPTIINQKGSTPWL